LIKPLLEIIFENLFDSGFRTFCFIIGRGKDTIQDHLSPHYDFIDLLRKKGESEYAAILQKFYKKLENSSIFWIRQHTQNGISPATLLAEPIIADKPFLFHAGDLYIPTMDYLKQLSKIHSENKPVATVGIRKVTNPTQFGVATLKKISSTRHLITHVVEKPKKPSTNFALTGVNVFEPEIFDAIRKTKPGVNQEIQLTDSIQTLIENKHTVMASIMKTKDQCIDIGTPSNYFKALSLSYNQKL
jgi:UTP--glucose-1-phosphate uridylyltransferase